MAMDGMSEAGSHYAVLGVAHEASVEEIRKAHRFLALKWHPDKARCSSSKSTVKTNYLNQKMCSTKSTQTVVVSEFCKVWFPGF
jgi:preprotein translocase subunit Sec63